MTYDVRLSREADRYLGRLPATTRARVHERLDQIGSDPFSSAYSKPLAGGSGHRSARVGDLRIIFRVAEEQLHIRVLRIAPRGQLYRNL